VGRVLWACVSSYTRKCISLTTVLSRGGFSQRLGVAIQPEAGGCEDRGSDNQWTCVDV
jgi:hypothetical protein